MQRGGDGSPSAGHDEADAALGTREASGDSGTSSRVFSMIASQMGDTGYRGKLIWMLLTSRPDLLPIDLKRQGRAEVHLPLFSPRDDAEVTFMITVMAKKNKFTLDPSTLPDGLASRGYSGADIESIVLSAKRLALTKGRDQVTAEDRRVGQGVAVDLRGRGGGEFTGRGLGVGGGELPVALGDVEGAGAFQDVKQFKEVVPLQVHAEAGAVAALEDEDAVRG